MEELPVQYGTYALIMELVETSLINVGRLGSFQLSPGIFVYLGSARGPGGLRARLGRHLSGEGRPHWHVDHLRAAAMVLGYGFLVSDGGDKPGVPVECQWSQALASRLTASIPILKFGASDCRSGCLTHLVYFKGQDFLDEIHLILNPSEGDRQIKLVVY